MIGVLLAVRHRTVRLSAALVAAAVVVSRTGGADGGAPAVLLIAGSLAAVAASRVLAPGPALAAARQAAGPWWLAPVARTVGVELIVVPTVLVAALLMGGVETRVIGRVMAVATLFSGAVAAATVALAPLMGASAAATLALVLTWSGGLRPSQILTLFQEWPYVQRPLVWSWNVLPLAWRADRAVHVRPFGDAVVLAAWTVAALVLAGWAAAHAYRGETVPAGGGGR